MPDDRCELVQSHGLLAHVCEVRVARVVEAVDRVERLIAVVCICAALGVAVVVVVRDLERVARVTLHHRAEHVDEGRPVSDVVERVNDRRDHRLAAKLTPVGVAKRACLQRIEEGPNGRHGRVDVRTERTSLDRRTLCQEGAQLMLEAFGLQLRDVVEARGGVEHAIQNQPAGVLGVQVRVGLAEQGAVGIAEIVELLVAERSTQQVEVTRRTDRVDVTEQCARVVLAVGAELLVCLFGAVHPLVGADGSRRDVEDHRVEALRVRVAADCR